MGEATAKILIWIITTELGCVAGVSVVLMVGGLARILFSVDPLGRTFREGVVRSNYFEMDTRTKKMRDTLSVRRSRSKVT